MLNRSSFTSAYFLFIMFGVAEVSLSHATNVIPSIKIPEHFKENQIGACRIDTLSPSSTFHSKSSSTRISPFSALSPTSPHSDEGSSSSTSFSSITQLSQALSPKSSCADPSFAQKVIAEYSLADGKSHFQTLITLRLHPDDWKNYVELQSEIAKIIPQEERRPVIDLTLTMTEENEVDRSIGISGGTGPLSDAELLNSIFVQLKQDEIKDKKKVNWDHFAVNLFSAPPPRGESSHLAQFVLYTKRMMGFATRGHNHYYLASNTAHMNIEKFRGLVDFTLIRRKGQLQPQALVDLALEVTRRAIQPLAGKDPDLLILGTLQAYEHQLYPEYLERSHLTSFKEAKTLDSNLSTAHFSAISSLQRAQELQSYIDLTKAGHIQEAGPKMKELIQKEVALLPPQKRPVRIILACTEIPLALHGSLLTQLKTELEKVHHTPIDLLDTEQVFAHKIVEDIQALNQE